MTSQDVEGKDLTRNEKACLKYGFPVVLVVLSFLVEFLSRWFSFLNLRVAFWMFWIGVGVSSLLGALELFTSVYHFVNENFRITTRKAKEYTERIERERKKIEELLDFKIGIKPDEEIMNHYCDLAKAEFSKEALAPYLIEWHNHFEEIHSIVQEDNRTREVEELEEQKELLLKEIKALQKEKKQGLEGEKYNAKKEEFLKKYEERIHIDASDLEEGQKRWLEETGFLRTHQWCINKKDSVEFLIKPRHNESLSHAYLTSAIFDYVKRFDPDARLSATKTADIIFTSKNNCWAVEIETGKVHEKNKKQLLEKVKVLDEKFPERWFFVVTNKNLLSKYHKLGEAVDRSGIIGRVDEIFSSK